MLVDHTGGEHENRAQNEVGQLAHTGAGAEGQVQQVLHQLNSDAVYRAQREGAQQGGQVGDVQLDKGRHQRNGEFDELQHGGHSRQHGSHGQMMGSLFLLLRHEKSSFSMV